MGEQAYNEANRLFVDEEYSKSLEFYDQAINLSPSNVDYLLKRSACHMKLKNFTDALADANTAINLDSSNAQSYLKKGIACFSLEEYETAKAAFDKGFSLDPQNNTFKVWLRKCETELGSTSTNQSSEASTPSVSTPAPTPAPSSTSTSSTTTQSQSGEQVATTPKIRHEWYQTETDVIVTVFIKNAQKDDVKIRFEEKELEVDVVLPGSNFVLDVDLCDEILPKKSTFQILSTKIEIRLKKKSASRWSSLEATDAPIKVTKWDDVSKVDKHSYPSSSKTKKDWDKMAKEAAEEKLEGEQALNKVFQDIFQGGDEEQRRAMMKSFYESGGTVLSTNWNEVGKEKVKGSAPKGMEMHTWDEAYKK